MNILRKKATDITLCSIIFVYLIYDPQFRVRKKEVTFCHECSECCIKILFPGVSFKNEGLY